MVVIGITGFSGAGKDTVAEYLEKKHFKFLTVRKFLTEEIERRGLPLNRDSMIEVANELRNTYGAEYIVSKLYEQAKVEKTDCTISSIRTVGEVEALKAKNNFVLIAVTAPLETRYERICQRGNESDHVTLEKFKEQEEKENQSNLKTEQNIFECIKRADYFINNTYEEKEPLHQEIDLVVQYILEHDIEHKTEVNIEKGI